MENEDSTKVEVQTTFKEFVKAVDVLPNEKKERNAEGELILHDAKLEEIQTNLLTNYIKHPDFFKETEIDYSQKQLNNLLVDSAFKNDKPIYIDEYRDNDYYVRDHLGFALYIEDKIESKNIDLITRLANKIPASKVVLNDTRDEIPHNIQNQYPLRKPIVLLRRSDDPKNSHKNLYMGSHLQAARKIHDDTIGALHPILKKQWENVVSILKEKAPPEQTAAKKEVANTTITKQETQTPAGDTSEATTKDHKGSVVHNQSSSKDDDLLSPAVIIGAAAVYASIAEEKKRESGGGGRGMSSNDDSHSHSSPSSRSHHDDDDPYHDDSH